MSHPQAQKLLTPEIRGEALVQQAAAQDQVANFCHQSWQFLRAAEAGGALADYALGQIGLWRIVATTDYDNLASQRVMHKLGMALHRNPGGEPPYLQVVGVLQA